MTASNTLFVTGAASGIGKATALLFARKGWFVGLFDLNEQGLKDLAAHIGQENCCFKKMDVRAPEEVESAVNFFLDRTSGRMDILFNNAGILRMGTFETIALEDLHLIVDINLNGIINCISACLPALRETSGSRIINMSSSSASYGIPELAVYSATKHAVRGLTEALNIEFERFGIMVSDIMPAYVDTPMVTEAKVKASNVETAGINLTAPQVAETVWQAAQRKKIHWSVGRKRRLMSLVFALLPFLRRAVIKGMMNLENTLSKP